MQDVASVYRNHNQQPESQLVFRRGQSGAITPIIFVEGDPNSGGNFATLSVTNNPYDELLKFSDNESVMSHK